MIRLDLRQPVDTRAGREACAVAEALAAAGCPAVVRTPDGLAPRRFLTSAPLASLGAKTLHGCEWPPDPALPHPPVPVPERAYWRGEPKFEGVVAFAGREGWEVLRNCRRTVVAEFLGVDAEHEVNAVEQLKQAEVAVFVRPREGCLVAPADALAAGCAVLVADDWPLPPGVRAGEHLEVAAADEVPGALARLLIGPARLRGRLRDAGYALASRWRAGLLGTPWAAWFERRGRAGP